MKKIFALLLLGIGFTAPAFAQQPVTASAPKLNALKLVPQQFIAKTFQLDYERSLNPKTSLVFSPSVTAGNGVLDNDFDEVMGGGLEMTVKFYVGERSEPLDGFYAGLSGSFHRYHLTQQDFIQFDPNTNTSVTMPGEEANLNRYATNVTFGYQLTVQQIVAIDMYAGGGMRIGDTDFKGFPNNRFSDPGIFNYRYTGVAPKIGFSVGILF